MRNVTLKFTVSNNENSYFATSLKTAVNFCKKNDLCLWDETQVDKIEENEKDFIQKIDRGIYFLDTDTDTDTNQYKQNLNKINSMQKFIFLTENSNQEVVFFAIPENQVKDMLMSSTYDKNGHTVPHCESGDFITLLTDNSVKAANDSYNEFFSAEQDYEYTTIFEIGDCVYAYDNTNVFDAVIESCKESEYSLDGETIKGFNYTDGNANSRTVVVESFSMETTHTILENPALIEELNLAIETAEFVKYKKGSEIYKTEKHRITNSFYEGSWESYEIENLLQAKARAN